MNDVVNHPAAAAWLEIYENEWSHIRILGILITGSASVEPLIEKSVDLLDPEAIPSPRAVLAAVAEACSRGSWKRGVDSIAAELPKELWGAADLCPELRVCFVLRRLAGFGADQIAALLAIESREVEKRVAAASVQLAEVMCCAA